jgi:adaptin ear-binding coat-associated protein 1/2
LSSRAQEWEGNHIWSGRCKVVAKGNHCEVRLEDSTTGESFGTCPINSTPNAPPSVEPVTDSSRYFVLRVEDGHGNHAYIGLGFTERSEAFDFRAALQDHQKYVKREKSGTEKIAPDPSKDYSLKAGEMIHVNIQAKVNVEGPQSSGIASSSRKKGGSSALLPPPPGPGVLVPPVPVQKRGSAPPAPSTLPSGAPPTSDDWFSSDFFSSSSAPS